MRSSPVRNGFVRRLPLLLVGALTAVSFSLPVLVLPSTASATPGAWGPSTTPTPSQTAYPLSIISTDSLTPSASYSVDLNNPPGSGTGGFGVTAQEWNFQTTATQAGTVPVTYNYKGFHSFFQVNVHLTAFVVHAATTTTTPIVNDGPAICCTPPSGGFHYQGTWNFNVAVGDTYGFLFGGSNFDSNAVLQGTLSLAPVADPATATQNLSWTNAADLPVGSPGLDGTLTAAGEARWYKFPVTPGSQVQVDLTNLAQNFDLTMYSDIGATFTAIAATLNQPHALATLGAQSGTNAYAPSIYSPSIYSPSIYSPSIYSPSIYSPSIYSPSIYSPSIYSPSIYSPSIYSPSIYSPSIYSPSIYSPSIYSPSIYSPSIYSPSIYSPSPAFLQAFSSAQADSLVGVSANDGIAPESIRTPTWNNSGFFYVRVQGRNGAFSPTPFHLTLTVTGGACSGASLQGFSNLPTINGTPGTAQAVILTDTTRLRDNTGAPLTAQGLATFTSALNGLAAQAGGVVIDVSTSARIAQLRDQAAANVACVPAANLEAQAIRDVVNSYRDGVGTLKYVVLAGGDSVIPYFRYADNAGMGPESDFVAPVQLSTQSQASLSGDYILNQDAYGALSDLKMKNLPLPAPDLAVGRLVETDTEIEGQINEFLRLGGTLPTPSSTLVTGYDFLTTAADSVAADFSAGTSGPGLSPTNDQLITDQGVKTTVITPPLDRSHSWTATDLANALLTKHHDLVFLAGHFNAQTALAADYSTSFANTQLDATLATGGVLKDSLVFSAGCHSGYNLLNTDGLPGNPVLDWPQEMARQKATFIGGTGYQYADTVTLSYSAWLYAQLAKELRAGSGAVSVGQALVKAKQDYLNSVATFGGMDQKALLESALYGLPMVSIALPGQRIPAPSEVTQVPSTNPVVAGPGAQLGLRTAPLTVTPVLTPHSRAAVNPDGTPSGTTLLQWLSGPDGTQTTPGLPILPKQSVDVTPPLLDPAFGSSPRGVAILSGTYVDTHGVTPLTGAPTTEQNGVHTTFSSSSFFPQKMWNLNYFGALGPSGTDPRTRVVTTPVQYRADGPTTDTQRAYSSLGFNLYYSANTTTYAGGFTPALAAPPSISGVTSVVSADLSHVDVSAHVTGDPSAGIQEVWLTYTAEAGPFHGSLQSIALTQDVNDSTLWKGTLQLGAQLSGDVRFILQAVNGVGLVGMDTALGDGYTPVLPPPAPITPVPTTTTLDALNATANLGDTVTIGATTASVPAGTTITLSVGTASVPVTTDAAGHASATFLLRDGVGPFTVTASYAGDPGHNPSSASLPITVGPTPTALSFRTPPAPTTVVAHLATAAGPLGQQPVAFTLTGGPLGTATTTVYRDTDVAGDAHLSPPAGLAGGVYSVSASFTPASTAANPATLGPSATTGSTNLTVNQAPRFVASSPPTTTYVAQTYSYAFSANGQPSPTFALTGGPSWLSINATTGVVSGTPPTATSFSYSVIASNGISPNATAGPFNVTVGPAAAAKADLSVALSCPATAKVGTSITCTVKVTNAGPYTANKVVASVALPSSLTNAALSGGGKSFGGIEVWSTASLAAGASASYTVTATVAKTGTASLLALTASFNVDPTVFDNLAFATVKLTT